MRVVVESSYAIKALDESTWAAFAGLVERNNGIFGGCWCMAFHPEGGDRAAQGEINRRRKHDRVRSGTAHAALVFDGEECVGWCQFGAPFEVPRIKNRAAYEKSQTTSPDWRTSYRVGGGCPHVYWSGSRSDACALGAAVEVAFPIGARTG